VHVAALVGTLSNGLQLQRQESVKQKQDGLTDCRLQDAAAGADVDDICSL